MGFLDNTGVARLWEHIMAKFNELVGNKPVAEQIEEVMSAIDIPQSNWGQNDQTQKDYIHSRTHYIDGAVIDCTVDMGTDSAGWRRVSSLNDSSLMNTMSTLTNLNDIIVVRENNGIREEIHFDDCVPDASILTQFSTDSITYMRERLIYYIDGQIVARFSFVQQRNLQEGSTKPCTLIDNATGYYYSGAFVPQNSPIKSIYWGNYVPLDERYIPSTIARTSDIPSFDIPVPTPADVDKFLRVNSAGKYELDTVPNAEEATFGV